MSEPFITPTACDFWSFPVSAGAATHQGKKNERRQSRKNETIQRRLHGERSTPKGGGVKRIARAVRSFVRSFVKILVFSLEFLYSSLSRDLCRAVELKHREPLREQHGFVPRRLLEFPLHTPMSISRLIPILTQRTCVTQLLRALQQRRWEKRASVSSLNLFYFYNAMDVDGTFEDKLHRDGLIEVLLQCILILHRVRCTEIY